MTKLKKLFISLLIILLLIAFDSSYDAVNLNNIVVVVAMALDTSETNALKVTFQFTNASSVSDTGSTEQASSITNTIEASSISSAINIMNAYIGKELNLSHCKLIVFSEELATHGISDEIFTLVNDNQIRPSTNIVVSKCDAKSYIENSKPILEPLITKYYEVYTNSNQYTGYTTDASIGTFFNSLNCDYCEPYAILGGLNSVNNSSDTTINPQKDSDIKANDSPVTGELRSENSGLAVFKDDKLVGELNALENLSFLCTRNNIEGFLVSVPNPDRADEYLDIYLTPAKNCKISVSIVNGSPYVNVDYSFTGRIYSMTQDSDYLNSESLTRISEACNSYLQSTFTNYLYKTSKELNSDINGIGNYALSNFLSIPEVQDYNWEAHYKDSFFDVKVLTNVKSGFLLM